MRTTSFAACARVSLPPSANSTPVQRSPSKRSCVTIAPEEVRVSSRTLPDEYGAPYLDEADKCMAIASRMPAESQAYTDMMAVAKWYEQQYLAVRYEYLRDR